MYKAFLSVAILLLLIITASCSGESVDKSAEQSSEAATAAIGSPQITFFTVETEQIADRVSLNGRLRADSRVELFSEVPGKMMEGSKPFREGVSYQKGETLVQLDDSEARLQIQSSRSNFKTLVSALMPDIKLDYPETLPRYEEWFNSLSAENTLVEIPQFEEGVRRYLESKGVYELFYTIKSAEDRLEKFTIRAPFSGELSAANVERGQVVGPQLHLGTFVDPSLMILNAAIDPADARWIQPGMTLAVSNQGQIESYKAEVVRINPSVDLASQQVLIYLEVSGKNLREGMYLEGEIESETKRELARIPKSTLLRTGGVLAKREGSLAEVSVEIHDLERNHLWVSGLQNGDEIVMDVSEPVSGQIIN